MISVSTVNVNRLRLQTAQRATIATHVRKTMRARPVAALASNSNAPTIAPVTGAARARRQSPRVSATPTLRAQIARRRRLTRARSAHSTVRARAAAPATITCNARCCRTASASVCRPLPALSSLKRVSLLFYRCVVLL
jgi:hypothetical protein